jgi:hypothetical protein
MLQSIFNNATTLLISIDVTQHSLHKTTYSSIISDAASVSNVRRCFVTGSKRFVSLGVNRCGMHYLLRKILTHASRIANNCRKVNCTSPV